MAGIDVAHVPYKGTPEAIGDTIAGRVCCYFAPINAALPHIKGGKALALAVTSAQRSSLLPEVPTIAESGVRGFDYTLWVGLWGPAAMPAELVNKINADVNKALASHDLAQRLTNLGTIPMKMTSAEFTRFVRQEVEDTAKVLKAAGTSRNEKTALALLAACALPAHAQTYPTKPVQVIISSRRRARPTSSAASSRRSCPSTGASRWSTRTAPGRAARSAPRRWRKRPDGYTLLINSNAHSVNPAIYAKPPYETTKDFTDIAPLSELPNVLVVSGESRYKTLAELVASEKPTRAGSTSAMPGSAAARTSTR